MKRIFYLTIACLLLSFNYSCSSDNIINKTDDETSTNDNLYDVSIKLSSFESEFDDLRSTSTDNSDLNIKHLFYEVYDISNNIVIDTQSIDTDTVIEVLKIRLRKGKYKLSLFASDKSLTINQDRSLAITDLSNPNIFQATKDFELNDSNINETIKLSRPIGKISLAISDLKKMPADVKSITPILVRRTIFTDPTYNSDTGGYYEIPKYIEIRTGYSYYLDRSAVDEYNNPMKDNVYQTITMNRDQFSMIDENNLFDFYLPDTEKTRLDQSYSAGYDAAYDIFLIGSKTDKVQFAPVDKPEMIVEDLVFMKRIAKNISILPNKQVIIKGKFFGDDQLTISIDDIWGETIENEFN